MFYAYVIHLTSMMILNEFAVFSENDVHVSATLSQPMPITWWKKEMVQIESVDRSQRREPIVLFIVIAVTNKTFDIDSGRFDSKQILVIYSISYFLSKMFNTIIQVNQSQS